MSDTTHSILHSASKFLSGTALSRVTGMVRDIALAYAFGTQSSIAALLVAFRLAHLLRRVLGEGAMQTALIPLFEGIRKDDHARGAVFFHHLLWSISLLLVGLIGVIMGALWILLKVGGLSSGNEEIAWLTFLMMPSLLFICLFGINACLLQCEKWYFITSAAPILFNIVWIIGIACTAHLAPAKAVSGLALFIVIACLCQWLVTVPKTIKILKEHASISFWKHSLLSVFSPDVRSLAKPLSLAIVGIAATQINSALDAIFARWADPEGPAILWYAIRLQQLPLALIGVALSGALLPPLARAAKSNDTAKFFKFLDFSTKTVIAWMIPITAMICLFGDVSISLIYGHGDFTQVSAIETTQALWCYGLGIVPMALILVYAPALYATGDYKTPSMAAAGSMVLNGVLNFLLVGVLDMGTPSIALATSVSAFMNYYWLERSMSRAGPYSARETSVVSIGLKTIGATLFACGATMLFQYLFDGLQAPLFLAERVERLYELSNLGRGVSLALQCGVFVASLLVAAKFLNIAELTRVMPKADLS